MVKDLGLGVKGCGIVVKGEAYGLYVWGLGFRVYG
jgi:hypothetical protein